MIKKLTDALWMLLNRFMKNQPFPCDTCMLNSEVNPFKGREPTTADTNGQERLLTVKLIFLFLGT